MNKLDEIEAEYGETGDVDVDLLIRSVRQLGKMRREIWDALTDDTLLQSRKIHPIVQAVKKIEDADVLELVEE